MSEIQKSDGFSRRTMLQAGAWAVPVIAVAAATPGAAASQAGDFTIYNQSWSYFSFSSDFQYVRLVVQNAGSTAPTGGFVQISTPTASGPYNLDPSRTQPFTDGTGTAWVLIFPLTQRPANDGETLTGTVTLLGLGSVPLTDIISDF
ncbi:hypothetical protein [Herbiconiux sp. A18JL235]|uniref:Twin-arginine translocation signal domain-containing protein n=1 Tax=Herbiconiux sp. A18JL235 TaxID=3152363 RepID=A0AB39BE57_9MICO